MGFETPKPEEKNEKITQASEKLSLIVEDVDTDTLERAIRFLGVSQREKLYKAVEVSKTATDDLMHKE